MKTPSDFKKRIFLFAGLFGASSLLCLGQTNSSAAATAAAQNSNGNWEKVAKSYNVAQAGTRTDQATAAKPSKNTQAPDQAAPSGSPPMNAETESAQFERIEQEGLLQSRQAMREANRNLTLQSEMGMLEHDPEALCLGESPAQFRILGTGTASGVP